MGIKCFMCGGKMIESRMTGVGELPPKPAFPTSLYLTHEKQNKDCHVADYVIQIGYRV